MKYDIGDILGTFFLVYQIIVTQLLASRKPLEFSENLFLVSKIGVTVSFPLQQIIVESAEDAVISFFLF